MVPDNHLGKGMEFEALKVAGVMRRLLDRGRASQILGRWVPEEQASLAEASR